MTAVVLVLAVMATASPAGAAPADSAAVAPLQGTWIFTALVFDGTEVPRPHLDSARLIVAGGDFIWSEQRGVTQGHFTASRDTLPWAIDLVFDSPERAGETALGIWRLDDGWLTLCLGLPGEPRPDDFVAPPGSGRSLQILTQDPRETTLPDVGPLPER